MKNHWILPRNKRTLVSVPLVLAVFNTALGREWTRTVELELEQRLEDFNLKRRGERRDQGGSGARTYRAWLYCLGLIFREERREVYRLTRAGERLFSGESPVEIITNQLMKFQFPSSYSIGRNVNMHRRFQIHPFRFLLSLMRIPEINYLTQEEIALFVITEADSNSDECLRRIADKILNWRRGRLCIDEDEFINNYPSRNGVQSFEKTTARLNDNANTFINFLEYTQLVARDFDNRLRIIDPDRVNSILERRVRLQRHPERHEVFQRYFGLGPGDIRDNRSFGSQYIMPEQVEESLVRAAFHDLSRLEILDVNNDEVIERIASRTGLLHETVRAHLRAYSGRERDIMTSSYVAMAFAGREESTDFEIATANLLGERGLGFRAIHVGGPGRGLQPDVYIQDGLGGPSGIVDAKAYSAYSIPNDHRNRMLQNYIPQYREQDGELLSFIMYVAGGFGNRFEERLQQLAQDARLGGIGITAADLLNLVCENQTRREYVRRRLIELAQERRRITPRDFAV